MTQPEIPRAVLVALAEAAHEYSMKNQLQPNDGGLRLLHAIDAYRSAKRPLRSRAEVDVYVVLQTRRYVAMTIDQRYRSGLWPDIERLCSEPTSDEPNATDRCGPCASHGVSNPAGHDSPCLAVMARPDKFLQEPTALTEARDLLKRIRKHRDFVRDQLGQRTSALADGIDQWLERNPSPYAVPK